MIVFGSGGETLNLGVIESKHCETCDTVRPFIVLVQYRYWGLYWVFNFVTARKHFVVCDVCRRGAETPSQALESRFRQAPIPFMRRYGLATLMGAIVGLPLFFGVLATLLGAGQ